MGWNEIKSGGGGRWVCDVKYIEIVVLTFCVRIISIGSVCVLLSAVCGLITAAYDLLGLINCSYSFFGFRISFVM